jgi:transposase
MALTFRLMRHILYYMWFPLRGTLMKPDPKHQRLKRQGVLNPSPERVRAPWFQAGDFFDAHDLVQTKYEMLRHVRVDQAAKAEAAALFGMSRPTLYQAEAAFARDGVAGLLPKPRGPKGAHKLDAEVMAFIAQCRQRDGAMPARALAQEIASVLGLSVHPRSIERALARKKKP